MAGSVLFPRRLSGFTLPLPPHSLKTQSIGCKSDATQSTHHSAHHLMATSGHAVRPSTASISSYTKHGPIHVIANVHTFEFLNSSQTKKKDSSSRAQPETIPQRNCPICSGQALRLDLPASPEVPQGSQGNTEQSDETNFTGHGLPENGIQ